MSNNRKSWDQYFLDMLPMIGSRSTCDRGKVACIIVNKDNHILSTGYAGAPPGLDHCDDVGHLIEKTIHDGETELTDHCVRTIHAEQNAICHAAKSGTSIKGATLYCSMTPCATCAMLIISCGIDRVVVAKQYKSSSRTMEMFRKAGIDWEIIDTNVENYGFGTSNDHSDSRK